MYVFNTFDSIPGYLFASYEHDSGTPTSIMKYYDLESKDLVWSQPAGIDFDSANSIDIANDLFGDGNAVIVAGVGTKLNYFNAR